MHIFGNTFWKLKIWSFNLIVMYWTLISKIYIIMLSIYTFFLYLLKIGGMGIFQCNKLILNETICFECFKCQQRWPLKSMSVRMKDLILILNTNIPTITNCWVAPCELHFLLLLAIYTIDGLNAISTFLRFDLNL